MNKKGVSPVVAEILLVLLAIAAVAIVATVAVNFVGPTLKRSTECTQYSDYFTFKEEIAGKRYNCISNGVYGASITAKSGVNGSDIVGFSLVFVNNNGETTVVKTTEGVLKMFDGGLFNIPKEGDTYTYKYESGAGFKTMEVYPLLSNGRICDKTDSIDIIPCIG